MVKDIYRKRSKKTRYGFGRGSKSFQIHFGKRSLYLFMPFYSMSRLTDKQGLVTIAQSFYGADILGYLLHIRRFMRGMECEYIVSNDNVGLIG